MICIKCKQEIPDGSAFCLFCGKKQEEERRHLKRPNGSGSVSRIDRNLRRPWRARARGLLVGYYSTRREAEEALARLVGADVNEKYNWTFSQVFEAWKPEHYQHVGKSTQDLYDRAFERAKDLHERKFRELRPTDFQRVLDSIADRSVSTVEKQKQLFTQMTAWAVKNDICQKDYAQYATPSGKQAKPHEPLTAEEISRIEKDGSETARVVLMLLATGTRIGELFDLELKDYHGTYIVGGEKSEAGRDRIIPIRQEGRAHFAYFAEKAMAAGGRKLIDGYEGNRIANNFRKRDYHALLDRLCIDHAKTPHSTRTTYGTRAATEDNLAPAVLQKVMGHASFDTTQRYYNRPKAEQLVQAVETSAEGTGKNFMSK